MIKEHVLNGKTIKQIQIADDSKAVLFRLDNGEEIIARADGDCCSDTWIEHIELPINGFPAKVISANDIEMPDLGKMEGREVVAYYGFRIETDKGNILIDYRNDSNGYYGGNLSWPDDEYFYGGVYGQNNSTMKWIDIKD